MRMRAVVIVVAALLMSASVGTAAQQASAPPTIVSAKRCKSFARPNQTVMARDEVADVVVALRIRGISREDFIKIDDDTVYVMAGDERLPPAIVAGGRIEGQFEVLVVFVGPKAIRDMSLHFGTYPAAAFTAEEAIAEQLQ